MSVQFKAGDKVKGVNFTEEYSILNKTYGKVIFSNSYGVGVEWDILIYLGHNCDNVGKQGHCRYFTGLEAEVYKKMNASIFQLVLITKQQMEFEF